MIINNSKDKFLKIYAEKLKFFNYSKHTVKDYSPLFIKNN